jgi:Catalytic LigB subunit of aromatic ring-opening dioxygenase
VTLALVTMSHSPLMGFTEPAVETRERVDMALGGARKFVAEFDPELVVLFGPDHYNGFFYDMMPSFCIGASAESIGDYDTPAGPLLVDHDVAWTFVRAALDAEIDAWTTDWFTEQGGHSAHETRTSIAAYAALAAAGAYEVTSSFYEPIPDWIAGFAVTTALPRRQGTVRSNA